MNYIHVPRIDARYWLALTLASLFGTNLGDFYAHHSGLTLPLGLAVLALPLILVFVAERRDSREHQVYYWLAILIIRTGATNIADFLSFGAGIPRLALELGVVLLMVVLTWLVARKARLNAPQGLSGRPPTSRLYWVTMLTAGVLGTVLGDTASHLAGLGTASVALGLLLGVTLALTGGGLASVAAYWGTVAVARTAGTAVGDWLAESHSLNLGLPLATVLTGTALLTVLLFWRTRPEPRVLEVSVSG